MALMTVLVLPEPGGLCICVYVYMCRDVEIS